jgi:hypothetical protein
LANSKITNLTSLTAASGDEIPVNRAGSDGKVTAGGVAALAGTTGTYTVTGSELVPGGDLAADPFTGFGWTKDDTSVAWSGGVLTMTANGSTEFGTFYIPLSLTAGTRYLLEVHQTLSANVMVFAGFSNNFNILIPCTESVVKAEFYATFTGSFTLYGYLNNKVAATNAITSISIKELSAVSSSLTVEDFADNAMASLGGHTGNLALGVGALDAVTTGSNNVCFGHDAGTRITTSKDNIAIGSGALASCATGSGGGVCIGTLAGSAVTTGIANVAIGPQALMNATTAQQNVAIGNSALGVLTTGDKNTAIGFSLTGLTTGTENIGVGHNSGNSTTTGGYNIFLGYRTGLTNTTGSYNICIGSDDSLNVDVPTSSTGHYLNIGNTLLGDLTGKTISISATDLILGRKAAANLMLGAADAASPVAQTLSVQNVVGGTTDTAGADFSIAGSQGTGTGVGGNIVLKLAPPAASTGSTQNALVSAFTFSAAATTYTVATPASKVFRISAYDTIQFWNTQFGFEMGRWTGATLEVSGVNLSLNSNSITNVLNIAQSGYTEMVEMSAPSAPADTKVRIYTADAGGGKTKLMALFPTGAAQQIAIEP